MKSFFGNRCHRNALVGGTLSSYMLLHLRIIIVHQIASHGRISSSRDILEGVSKLIENLLPVSLVG